MSFASRFPSSFHSISGWSRPSLSFRYLGPVRLRYVTERKVAVDAATSIDPPTRTLGCPRGKP